MSRLSNRSMVRSTRTCVVGAGIAGLTTAYLLGKEGKRVVVLDDGPIASGQTRRTTAHLANALDERYYEIERVRGKPRSLHPPRTDARRG